MKKTFFKNLFRDIKKSFSTFLSITIIIAVGVAFYAGVRAAGPAMKETMDYYLSKYNFMDFKIMSTMGITEDDIKSLKNIDDIAEAEGGYSLDAVIEKNDEALIVNVNSITSYINLFELVEGRMPEKPGEAVVEERFLKSYNYKIGDEITLVSGNDDDISEKLKINAFKIVGCAHSPVYISLLRQPSSIGNGVVRGFIYIQSEAFNLGVYTDAYVTLKNDLSEKSLLYNKAYNRLTNELEEILKETGIERCEVRYRDVYDDAAQKIAEAEEKLNKAREEASDKFNKAYDEINEAGEKIKNEEEKLEDAERQLLKKLADGEKELEANRKKVEEGQEKLNSEKIQAALKINQEVKAKIDELAKLVELNPSDPGIAAQYVFLRDLYDNHIKDKDIDGIYESLNKNGMLEKVSAIADIAGIKQGFDTAQSELDKSKNQINELKAQLEKNRKEGLAEIAKGKKEIEESREKLRVNREKLEEEERKANVEFEKSEAEIRKNKEKFKDIEKPEWFILGRSANVGYENYRLDSERIEKIGEAFPLVFFLVAALVSLTTMTRMVQERRTEIGIMKALGFSTFAIVMHYLIFALLAGIIGSFIAISFAFKLFPPLIINAYASLYTISEVISDFNTSMAFQASAIAVILTSMAAVVTVIRELTQQPALLLRPKAPKLGKNIFLEKIPFIWEKLSFTRKVAARNIFRYKLRFYMTVIGVAACTALLITGFGLRDGITGATDNQFNKIYRYDFLSTLKNEIESEDEKDQLRSEILKNENIESIMFAYLKNITAGDDNSGEYDAFLVVPENKDDLLKYIYLTTGDRELSLSDDGVIITRKMAKLLRKKAGDTFSFNYNNRIYNVKIDDVTEHYFQHYVYMSPSCYKKITGHDAVYNNTYGLLKDESDTVQKDVLKSLSRIDDIGSVSFMININIDYNKTMKSLNTVVMVLIVSAGVLAIVVIYNLTNINISERKRELATIKLLGFYNNELAMYIYRENIILTAMGIFLGIFLGIVMKNFILQIAEINVLYFYYQTKVLSFVYSILLTSLFSVIINLGMYRKFDRIDMIESLKSME